MPILIEKKIEIMWYLQAMIYATNPKLTFYVQKSSRSYELSETDKMFLNPIITICHKL